MIACKEDIDRHTARTCACCGDALAGPVELASRCHPHAGVRATYESGSGVLVLSCLMCERTMIAVAVADAEHAAVAGRGK